MYELWHLGVAYAVGTAAGIGIYRHVIKEYIITATIDSLVEQEYVRSYEDDHGITHLYKWHDIEDVLERIQMIQLSERDPEEWGFEEEEENEKDDTP